MKFRRLSCVTAMTLFAALAIPIRLDAQQLPDKQQAKKQLHRYRLVDIGTFGGPASFINPSGNGGPYISMHGTTVGSAATLIASNPAVHGFFCSGLDGNLPFVFHAFATRGSDVTNLGALRSAAENCSDASAVNSTGEIVGGSENGVIDPLLGVTEIRAVLWKDGDIEDLGTFGGNDSQATAINNRGQVAGWALNSVPDPFSNLGTQQRPFLWQHGAMLDLGDLGGPDGLAVFVNERGQVAGASLTNSTPNPITNFPTVHPFLWDDGRMVDLGSLGGTLGFPNGLNNRGQVIGSMFIAGDQIQDMFLWDEGKLIDLTAQSGGTIVTANAINDAGEIVGAAAFSTNRPFDAYLWRHGVATDLGTLPGDCFSQAFAINAQGQVVGQSIACDFSTRSFLWDNGNIIDLNTFVPPGSGLQLVETVAINDRGEIAGDLVPPSCTGNPQGQDTQCGHAYVLIPCDDEHSDEGGCEGEVGNTIEAMQNSHTPINHGSANMMGSSVTPREIATRIQARFGRSRGFVFWPRR